MKTREPNFDWFLEFPDSLRDDAKQIIVKIHNLSSHFQQKYTLLAYYMLVTNKNKMSKLNYIKSFYLRDHLITKIIYSNFLFSEVPRSSVRT